MRPPETAPRNWSSGYAAGVQGRRKNQPPGDGQSRTLHRQFAKRLIKNPASVSQSRWNRQNYALESFSNTAIISNSPRGPPVWMEAERLQRGPAVGTRENSRHVHGGEVPAFFTHHSSAMILAMEPFPQGRAATSSLST